MPSPYVFFKRILEVKGAKSFIESGTPPVLSERRVTGLEHPNEMPPHDHCYESSVHGAGCSGPMAGYGRRSGRLVGSLDRKPE